MTDETTNKEKDLKQEVISEPPIDAVLHLMVTLSESGVGLPVTLFVNGIIIAGNIISFEKYMNTIADNLRKSENRTEMRTEEFQKITEVIADGLDKMRTTFLQAQDNNDRRMIHLESVTIVKPTGIAINPIGFIDLSNSVWRGSLASVDGFILGTLSK